MLKILEKQQKGTPKYQNHLKPRTFFFSFILFFPNFPVVLHFKQGYLECHTDSFIGYYLQGGQNSH